VQLSFTSGDHVQLKVKNDTVNLGETVSIRDYVLPGAGEYDVAGVLCEAQVAGDSLAYFIRLDDLQTTYLPRLASEVTKLDDASNCNILVVDVRSDDKPESLKPILKALEPSYVALIGAGATPEFQKALNLTTQEGASHKLTRSGLPLEGTILLVS
jgi:hypothetical protein